MIIEKFHLPVKNKNVTLTSYCIEPSHEMPYNNKRPAMLIFPGGAYYFCSDRESEPVAISFLNRGYNAFVLRYTIKGEGQFPDQLIEASAAVKFIKDNAQNFRIDPERIYCVGFSAGGHLCGSLGTMWHLPLVYEAMDMPYGYNKVNGMILSYAVLSSHEYAHMGSIRNLLGIEDAFKPSAEERDRVSIINHVDANTVPAFIWHTATDDLPVQNSLLMGKALADNNIPFELHVYPTGYHGLSLANENVEAHPDSPSALIVRRWVDDACRFFSNLEKGIE